MKLIEAAVIAADDNNDGNGRATKEDVLAIRLQIVKKELNKWQKEFERIIAKKRLSSEDLAKAKALNKKIGSLADAIKKFFLEYKE